MKSVPIFSYNVCLSLLVLIILFLMSALVRLVYHLCCFLSILSILSPLSWAGGWFSVETSIVPSNFATDDYWHLDRIQAFEAQAIACGEGVIVALVDSGVDASHPALKGHLLLDYAYNFADENTDIRDLIGHGTGMAGIILQVAPCAQILPLKINHIDSQSFETEDLREALAYLLVLVKVLPELKVVNLSLDLSEDDPEIASLIKALTEQGLLVVAAAGNDGAPVVSYMAALPEDIAVGALDMYDNRLLSSNYGTALTIVAPGVDIMAPYPGGGELYYTGTSPATALVSGALALLASLPLPRTALALLNGSQDLSSPGHDLETGFGLLDVYEALFQLLGEPLFACPSVLHLKPGQTKIVYLFDESFNAILDGYFLGSETPLSVISLEPTGQLLVRGENEGRGELYVFSSNPLAVKRIPVVVSQKDHFWAEPQVYPREISGDIAVPFLVVDASASSILSYELWLTSWQSKGFLEEIVTEGTLEGPGFYGLVLPREIIPYFSEAPFGELFLLLEDGNVRRIIFGLK